VEYTKDSGENVNPGGSYFEFWKCGDLIFRKIWMIYRENLEAKGNLWLADAGRSQHYSQDVASIAAIADEGIRKYLEIRKG